MLMGTRTCMNILCGATGSHEWKRGWVLGSGIIASLCYSCGSAYEQQVFCETFHADETGWRGCTGCGKRLHCGCIASLPLIELLDTGGVKCISCAKDFGDCGSSGQKLNGPRPVTQNNGQLQHLNSFKDLNGSGPVTLNNGKMQHLNSFKDLTGGKNQIIVRKMEPNMVHEQLKKEAVSLSHADAGSRKTPPVISLPMVTKDFGTFISLGGPASSPHPLFGTAVEEKEQGNTSSGFQLGTPSRQLLPKPSKLHLSASTDKSTSTSPLMRIPRPPVEGRGRNQMLPRYWPRITEQELQQISGDPNCTVVPLFEKVLSASDAGRIGRLVLPKACAEAYFPPISQPEGLPLKIQDIKGKEWVFQFRFWPNNNSRMYVLEGVTPCIQSMQLQAGDTVIFSRMDPEGKLVMGCRKASPALQSMKGAADPHINGAPKQTNSEHIVGNNGEKHKAGESAVHSEKKRYRNIGLKNKRLHIDGQDVIELKLTWEEVQDMLRVPKNSKPTVTMIEDSEIEEYEEPPVFGKWSIFGCRSTGVMEQWTQCDSCLKWRRLPPDVLLPPKWTCVDNVWDQSRCSCSAPDHLTPRDIENLLLLSKDCKKRKFVASDKAAIGQDPCGLETLANVATIQGDNASDSAPGPSSTGATTTKHPRHKPGCTCIVCIQPPSGKGKHKPMCDCNVCSTVKRRFQTLMLRKRKRQSVQEGEIANGKDPRDKSLHNHLPKDEAETESTSTHQMSSCFDHPTVEGEGPTTLPSDPLTINEAAKLDLNFDPQNEGKVCDGLPTSTMTSLLQLASHPLDSSLKQIDKSLTREQLESCMKQNGIRSLTEQLDSYMKQNGLKSSSTEQQVSSGLSGSVKVTREAKNQKPEDQTVVDCTMKESDEVVDGSCSLDRNPYGTP